MTDDRVTHVIFIWVSYMQRRRKGRVGQGWVTPGARQQGVRTTEWQTQSREAGVLIYLIWDHQARADDRMRGLRGAWDPYLPPQEDRPGYPTRN